MLIIYIIGGDSISNKRTYKSILKVFLLKLLILFILFLITIIFLKKDNNFKKYLKDNVFSNNISFYKIKNTYTKYFGSILPFYDAFNTESVFSERIEYNEINKYLDGYLLDVSYNYLVPVIRSGIVVYVGNKEEYGNTIIIESEDVVIWYSNIISGVNLYDEVKKGEYLGEVIDNKLYLVFKKDGDVVDYKEYI